jgi:hypothetical protein
MHRVLKPGGLLISSFLGEGMWEAFVEAPYAEDEVGMAVLGHWRDGGAGSTVFHSEWWLREHWGRAFEIVEVARPPRRADGSSQITHSYISARKHPGACTREDLERCDPAEPREVAGLQTRERLLRAEIAELVHAQSSCLTAGAALRETVLRSPLGEPAKALRDRVRRFRRHD